MARLADRSGRSKDLEIIALRHQLAVLARRNAAPVITDDERSLRCTTNNPTWGYRRIHGELLALGHCVEASTIWRILKNHRIDPAPQRSTVTWTQFLRSKPQWCAISSPSTL